MVVIKVAKQRVLDGHLINFFFPLFFFFFSLFLFFSLLIATSLWQMHCQRVDFWSLKISKTEIFLVGALDFKVTKQVLSYKTFLFFFLNCTQREIHLIFSVLKTAKVWVIITNLFLFCFLFYT